MKFQEAWRLCTYHRYFRLSYKEMLQWIWLPTEHEPNWTMNETCCSPLPIYLLKKRLYSSLLLLPSQQHPTQAGSLLNSALT